MALHLDHLQMEVDAAYLYRCVARQENDENLREIYLDLARLEDSHVESALAVLRSKGIEVEKPGPSFRARVLNRLGKWFGYSLVVGVMIEVEGGMAESQTKVTGKTVTGESLHMEILKNARSTMVKTTSLKRAERRYRGVGDNALRASVLGANDGLVSNMSLVMGVVGAAVSNNTVVVIGIAGLLAGALSMAMGEWISVQSSKEMADRQLALEMEEIKTRPDLEQEELELIYRAGGVPRETARQMAADLMNGPDEAGKAMVRAELRAGPNAKKDKALEAAVASFVLFAIGAIIPVVAFVWMEGRDAVITSLAMSTLGLFILGAATSLFTGRSVWFTGFRQVIIGLGAAGITFFIGRLIGISVL